MRFLIIPDVQFLISVGNKYDLEIHQLDFKTTFLNGELEKEVFMEIPEVYVSLKIRSQGWVLKFILFKCAYLCGESAINS